MVTGKKKMNIGVIGLGHQSLEDHIPAIFACPDVKLIGVSDIDKDKLESFSKENAGIHTYENFDGYIKGIKKVAENYKSLL